MIPYTTKRNSALPHGISLLWPRNAPFCVSHSALFRVPRRVFLPSLAEPFSCASFYLTFYIPSSLDV